SHLALSKATNNFCTSTAISLLCPRSVPFLTMIFSCAKSENVLVINSRDVRQYRANVSCDKIGKVWIPRISFNGPGKHDLTNEANIYRTISCNNQLSAPRRSNNTSLWAAIASYMTPNLTSSNGWKNNLTGVRASRASPGRLSRTDGSVEL